MTCDKLGGRILWKGNWYGECVIVRAVIDRVAKRIWIEVRRP